MQWLSLFRKEVLENWSQKKWIWVPLVFILLTTMDAVTYYFLPEILEHTGGVPEGTIFQIPDMTSEQVILLSLEQLGMFGTLLVGFITMGTIAGERRTGTMEIILAKPISSSHFVTTKWAANALLIFTSLAIGLAFSSYYISILYQALSLKIVIGLIFFYSLWLLLVLSISIFYNSFIRSPGLVLGSTIGTVIAMSVINSIFGHKWTMWPNQMASHLGTFVTSKEISTELIGTSLLTVGLSVLLILAAILLCKKSESI